MQESLSRANAWADETFLGIRTIFAFGLERYCHARYDERITEYFHLNVMQTIIASTYYSVCNTFLINTVVQCSLLFYATYLLRTDVWNAYTGPKILLTFMFYQAQLQEYALNLLNSFTNLVKASGAGAKVTSRTEHSRPFHLI